MAEASFPDIRARSRPGTAIAARMPMIATTMSSSISVKPSFFRISLARARGTVIQDKGRGARRAPLPAYGSQALLQDLRGRHRDGDRGAREVLVDGPAVVGRKRARARLTNARRRCGRVIRRLRSGVVTRIGRRENRNRIGARDERDRVAALDDAV